ncbi:hypothetical protein TRIUR3_10002 [Triticum urartu]|uniref:Uncharacterized protein n=2 Tax=Triticum TaxID=4564 RepID=A0A9R0TIY4_TRITD|nr:hypothetical protein TRIUR3_10002 [Triticum urartu]VAI14133.1 unnamed protein product [Triticum turgidum subsp. durum]
MGSSSKVVRPEEVLESLKNDGTVDALRMKIMAQLKADEDMKKNTMMMVEQSKVLKTPGAEKKTKRELFDALRQELDGIDVMPPPASTSGAPQEKQTNMAVEEDQKDMEMDASEPSSSSRKRPFSDISVKGAGAIPNGGATYQHDDHEDGN